MMKYTPLQTVKKCHGELRSTIRLIRFAEGQLSKKSALRIDLGEVENVLQAMAIELGRMIRALEKKDINQWIRRPGADLALKASVAKATGVAVGSLKLREDGTSSK